MRRLVLTAGIVLAFWILVGGMSGGSAAALKRGRQASVLSISCVAPGDCTAGGFDRQSKYKMAFLDSETSGSWGNPVDVPGMAALTDRGSRVISISCAASGECAAGGYYSKSRRKIAYVVSETNGSWENAIAVPGMATLSKGPDSRVISVSCGSVGDCAAGGYYIDRRGNEQAFVASEKNGSWGKAVEVPGAAKLTNGGSVVVKSVSCAAAGECTAGGSYADRVEHTHAFVVNEVNGLWRKAIQVPGTARLNRGGGAATNSVSCAAPGDCAAGGDYSDSGGDGQAFVVSETNGRWAKAIEAPGTAALNMDPYNVGSLGQTDSISCAAVGECAAGGMYTDGTNKEQAFVVDETGGRWGNAIEVPGTERRNTGGWGELDSISCASPGACAAGGFFTGDTLQALVAGETKGDWGNAIQVPKTATLKWSGTQVNSISCAAPGYCAAGGHLSTGYNRGRAFVVSETHGSWGNAMILR